MDSAPEIWQTVNALDIGIALLLLVSAVLAYVRGLAHEVLSVGGWIGAMGWRSSPARSRSASCT